MSTLKQSELVRKQEPMSHGRTDLRKRKPKQLAVINENCAGCAGSPACVEYCPVESCMFWTSDEDHPPFGRIEVDKTLCIGCARCNSRGPDGMLLEGCPWEAIDSVPTEVWQAEHDVELPAVPDPNSERLSVPRIYT
ncbi:MAG: 4Fe-4S ferredoxin [Planctomycetota bacterium]|jgi:ferredoxin